MKKQNGKYVHQFNGYFYGDQDDVSNAATFLVSYLDDSTFELWYNSDSTKKLHHNLPNNQIGITNGTNIDISYIKFQWGFQNGKIEWIQSFANPPAIRLYTSPNDIDKLYCHTDVPDCDHIILTQIVTPNASWTYINNNVTSNNNNNNNSTNSDNGTNSGNDNGNNSIIIVVVLVVVIIGGIIAYELFRNSRNNKSISTTSSSSSSRS